MKKRDLRTINAIIADRMGLLETIRHDDDYLIHSLRKTDRQVADWLKKKLDETHTIVQSQLQEARRLTGIYLQNNKGILPLQLDELFRKITAMNKILLSEEGGEISLLDQAARNFDGNTKKALEKRKDDLDKIRHSLHFRKIEHELKRLSVKKDAYAQGFGISFRRAKTRQSFSSNNHTAHVHVFFDEHVSPMKVKGKMEIFFFRVETVIDRARAAGLIDESRKQKMLENVSEARARYEQMSLYHIQKGWADMLADMCGKVMTHNKDLFLTPTTEIQVRIQEDKPVGMACDVGNSCVDLYLLKVRLMTIIIIDAVIGNPHSNVDSRVIRYFIKEITDEFSPAKPPLGRRSDNRPNSLLNMVAHELEHARDQIKSRYGKDDIMLFNHLLRKTGYYHHESSRAGQVMRIVKAMRRIRNEAPSQLRERFVKLDGKYAHTRPLRLDLTYNKTERIRKDMDALLKGDIEELGNRAYDASLMAAVTIMLADMKRKGNDIILLDTDGTRKLGEHFKEHGIDNTMKSAIRYGEANTIRRYLQKWKIPIVNVGMITTLLHRNHSLYLLAPPQDAIDMTIKKVHNMDDVEFVESYMQAASYLDLHDRLISPHHLDHLVAVSKKDIRRLIKRAGFRP